MNTPIALRSVLRHRRRSLSTVLLVAIGAAAMLVFGAFMLFSRYGLQTATVRANGHLTVYREGYYTFGAGNPAAWGIPDYRRVLNVIRRDRELASLLVVATPVQAISGIISDAETNTSKTFFGVGFVPSERDMMRAWNAYGTASSIGTRSGMSDADPSQAVVGIGMAKVLGLCERLHVADCPPRPVVAPAPGASAQREDFTFLDEQASTDEFQEESEPVVQLLGATVAGAPNVVDAALTRAEFQGVKALDDNYVGLHLARAQQLVYGRDPPQTTGIVLLLHQTSQIESARTRLRELIKANRLDLEIRDFTELSPTYKQATGLYQAFFVFISLVIGLIVIFSVANAVGMSVLERTPEIGTLRALGLNRLAVGRQFVAEGAILGVVGATLGVLFAFGVAYLVNRSSLSWTPPGNAQPVPIRLYMYGDWRLPAAIWSSLVLVAVLASVTPAVRASRLRITDALRYV